MLNPKLGSIDRTDVLIVRGVDSTDELASLGLPFSERYQAANSVVLVNDGRGREVKGREISGSIAFVDADPRTGTLARVLGYVFNEYQRAHPKQAHLAHCIVGKMLFYCFLERDGRPVSVMDLISDGDVDAVEQIARHFVGSGFQDFFARPSAISQSDGDPRDAAGADLDQTPDADSGADGVG